MSPKKEYDGSRVHLSLAGSGDPWSSLTKLRKRILRELHDTPDIDELASILKMTPDELRTELRPLKNTSLVFESSEGVRPAFLVTDERETSVVYNHACEFSKSLADITEENFADIEASYEKLELSKTNEIEDVALFFVGGRIIDIKLLDKLTTNNRVMPPAPARPSPQRPDAHYYFFMVEGDPIQLGGWGQDDSNMPWEKWHFITFGQNLIDGKVNPERRKMEQRYTEIIESSNSKSPEEVGNTLGVPIVTLSDSNLWELTADIQAEYLCQCFEEHEESIRSLHTDLKSGKYAPHSYGEYLCWYAHIAYASAIDLLEARGILSIPASRFQATVWCRERNREGMLSEI
ncbi:MAG: hypothetical protein ACW98Y_06345 [Candidatus Thorarchaeota archaeon]|jgi:DNA-binding transcriptional ArsR family regulator